MKKNVVIALVLAACSGAQTSAEGPDKTTDEGGSESSAAVCGDETKQADEVCDGPDLGGRTCEAIPGFTGGALACAADCMGVDTSMCTADPGGAIVRLNELTSSKVTDGPYAGAGDAIELVNIGMSAADLSGWKLSDDAALAVDATYVFPAGSAIMPGAYLVLVKLDDVTMMGEYPFGISSTDPESIQLVDGGGTVIDTVDFVGADATVSWCRLPDGDGDWQGCARTFGASNEPGVADGTTTDPSTDEGSSTDDTGPVEGPVVLNEISSSGDDEIEIYNAGPGDADLSGWTLTDVLAAPDDPYDPDADVEKLVFAAGTTLAAGEWLVVIKGMAAPDHPFGLSADGDAVTLLDADLQIVDFTAYGAMEAATSYCRVPDGPDGEWQADCTATFGDANAQ